MDKDYYISKISGLSDKYGDKLLLLMDKYGVDNLSTITAEEAKEFWEEISTECPAVAGQGDKREVNNWCSQSKYMASPEQKEHCNLCKLRVMKQENDKKNSFVGRS